MMTSRERVAMLLNKELPDRMGLYEHYWPETLNQYWPEQGYAKGASPFAHFDYDIQPIPPAFNPDVFPGRADVVEENDRWRIVRDGRGATLKYWKTKSGTPEHIGFECTTPEVWATWKERLVGVDRARLCNFEESRKAMEAVRATGRYVVCTHPFVFELMRGTIGDQTFLPAMLTDPDWLRDFCQTYLDLFRAHYEIYFREVGVPDGMMIYEDLGFRNGLFASPAVLGELVIPYHKALNDFFKEYGLKVILHSCGDIRRAVPLIIEAGYDCLQPMEAKAGCNVVELARTYGNRLAYMGNINIVELESGDRDRIRDEIVPKLEALRERRIPYFFHSDHSVSPGVSLESYRYALEVFRAHANY